MINEQIYKDYEKRVIEPLKKLDFENNQTVATTFVKQYLIETKIDPFIKKIETE